MTEQNLPKCFISYSWDSKLHQEWVRELATNLQNSGVDTQLDQWDLKAGQDMMEFMEYSVRTSDFVLLICTTNFAEKANAGRGGVGYEKSIVTGEIFYSAETTKFIPLLVEGSPKESLPSFLKSKVYIDFRKELKFEEQFEELIRDIYNTPKFPKPQIGTRPDFSKPFNLKKEDVSNAKEYLHFKFSTVNYSLKHPSWWNTIDVDLKSIKIPKGKTIEDFVKKNYGADVGTNENWKFAFKTYALYFQNQNRMPFYLGHCATGKDSELSIKIFSELYYLINFNEDKKIWLSTYFAYKVGTEYSLLGQVELAITWFRKSIEYKANQEGVVKYYAEKSYKQLQLLEALKKK